MSKPDWISDRRLYLDADGNVVESDNPAKLTLLVAKGGALPFEVAKRYRLIAGETAPLIAEATVTGIETYVVPEPFVQIEAPISETVIETQSPSQTIELTAAPVQPAPSKPKGKKK